MVEQKHIEQKAETEDQLKSPNRPDQVLGISNIKAGQSYSMYNEQGDETKKRLFLGSFTVIGEPVEDPEGNVKANISCEEFEDGKYVKTDPREISLADYGVVSYPDGRWNHRTFLVSRDLPSGNNGTPAISK